MVIAHDNHQRFTDGYRNVYLYGNSNGGLRNGNDYRSYNGQFMSLRAVVNFGSGNQ
jgi:hypothetical protein